MSTYYVLKIEYSTKPSEVRNIEAAVTSLGREAGDIVLGDPQSSGRHAELHFQGGALMVRDLGSTNGTYFAGQRVNEFPLGPGQSFSIGQTVITLMAIQGGQPAKQPMKTMIAMGGLPPRLAGQLGGTPAAAPPARPPAAPPPPPAAARPPAPPSYPAAPPPQQPAYAAPVQQQQQPAYAAPMQQQQPAYAAPMQQQQQQPAYAAPMQQPQPQQQSFGKAPPQQGFGGAPPPQQGFGGAPPPQQGFGGGAPQMAPMGGGAMAPQAAAGATRATFTGTGGEVFGQLFVGGLLLMITAGIYFPWFLVKMTKYVTSRTSIGPTARGQMRMAFTGTGGELFVNCVVGMLLSMITLGIYYPWFICKMIRWGMANTSLTAEDGTQFRLRFDGTGGQFFVTLFVAAILTIFTLYIYLPWAIVKVRKWMLSKTAVTQNGQQIGVLEFVGKGGELFGTVIVGMLLTVITCFIYKSWFDVNLTKFWAHNTRVHLGDRTIVPRFSGTGGELFVIMLIGGFLLPLTLGIYAFWLIARIWRFQINNYSFESLPPQMGVLPQQGQQGAIPGR